MQSSQWKTNGLVVALACVLSLGLMSPGVVGAGQVKKDVCHLEGTGDYHVINIAEPAWQTHYDHGDGDADGGEVPGMEGYVFDAECNLVEAVSCPCDFSKDNFEALGGDPEIATCEVTSPDSAVLDPPIPKVIFSENGIECEIVSNEVYELHETTNDEAVACVQDILATADALGIPCN